MFFNERKRRKIEEEDDGRSFADMNVEGMPWYRPEQSTDAKDGDKPQLTESEYKSFMWGAIKAGLLIVAVFAGVYFLFILFLDVVVFGN